MCDLYVIVCVCVCVCVCAWKCECILEHFSFLSQDFFFIVKKKLLRKNEFEYSLENFPTQEKKFVSTMLFNFF